MADVNPPAVRLEIRGLEKRFRNTVAVAGIDLELEAGELVGLIGPNGAGKTTTIKVVTGQILADAGTVRIDGHDILDAPLRARQLTGYVPQEVAVYPFLTGREVLAFVAAARGCEGADATIDHLLERFRLSDAQHRMTREYSDGMRRKLAVACALVGDPALLVLDESLTGLDPRAVAEVKEVIGERRATGTAVIFVSHMLDTVERLCSRVALMDAGRLVGQLDRAALDDLDGTGRTLEQVFLELTG